MSRRRDFLVEIGTEELPPKSLLELAQAFAAGVERGLESARLQRTAVEHFATPRRLAVRVRRLVQQQPDQVLRRTGPAIAAAFDAQGQPTRAALGFAASCGVDVHTLERTEGPKGPVLLYVGREKGRPTVELLPDIVRAALDSLPIARRMRWGGGDTEFVRPVHWVLMLFGSDIVPGEILGQQADRYSRGHRFHAPGRLRVPTPARYEEVLRSRGRVMVNIGERREAIRTAVTAAAQRVGGSASIDPALLDEVTALVEWPVAIAGRFEERFLALPPEVPTATMQDHQRYFPVRAPAGALLPWFVAIANIESRDPDKVREGNERVIRPRLADAAFFWDMDRRRTLASRTEALACVTYQNRLGSMADKVQRVRYVTRTVAARAGADPQLATRAAELCKCDLLTEMVGEFPELQGLMGRYYALHDGEPAEVASAIEEHYRPRFAGDELPSTASGRALAIADKLDTIAGIFAVGQKPSGARDPFGLRRAALGVVRIAIEAGLDLDLPALIAQAVQLNLRDMHRVAAGGPAPVASDTAASVGLGDEIYEYMMERLRAYYLEGEARQRFSTEMFDAVLSNRPTSPLDFDARLRALAAFLELPEAGSLALANKRIANILRKSESEPAATLEQAFLEEAEEQLLAGQIEAAELATRPLMQRREYAATLQRLAGLRPAVDVFFDKVLVMAPDQRVRANRLALLCRLERLFLQIADLSRLPG